MELIEDYESFSEVENIEIVAREIRGRGYSQFIEFEYVNKEFGRKINNNFGLGFGYCGYRTETVKRKVLNGYDITEEKIPYYGILVSLIPQFPNL